MGWKAITLKVFLVADNLRSLYRRAQRWWTFFKQRRCRGWDDSELWALDGTIATFVLPRLMRFRDVTNSYPAGMTYQEWLEELDDMIYALTVSQCELTHVAGVDLEVDWERAHRGYRLFGERFRELWW